MADIDTNTGIMIAAIGAASAVVGGFISSGTNFLIEWQKGKNEDKKRKRDESENWIKSRNAAYYDFLSVFSETFSGNSEIYLKTVLNASEFGELTLAKPIAIEGESIESLRDLIRIILKLRNDVKYSKYRQTKITSEEPLIGNSAASWVGINNKMIERQIGDLGKWITEFSDDQFNEKFDKIRSKAAEAFISPIMDSLKTSNMQVDQEEAKKIKKW